MISITFLVNIYIYIFLFHFNNLKRRQILDIKINEKIGNDIIIALDSTDLKIANRGDWIQRK
jgi:hypothetical protein